MRIFLVENHPDTLRWLAVYLQDCGHTVGTAQSVAEALATLPNSRWDVLIADIGLPDGSGWDILEKLHLPYRIFGVAMSGFGRSADSRRSRAAGFQHHLVKPFKMNELDRLLEEAASQPPE